MPNPSVLVCDTDALIQLFLTVGQTRLTPLRTLRDDYGIQPVIIAEVEIELISNRRHGIKVAPELRKALGNGTIEVLDVGTMSKFVPPELSKGVFGNYQTLGNQYAKIADRGEAYTLAAAVTLNVPAVSNDITALRALDFHGHQLPSPVLRSFDLLAFSLQSGALTEKECDATRKELVGQGEHVPAAFKHASFGDGIKQFCLRICDGNKSPIGIPPSPGPGYTARIHVARK